MSIYSSDQLLPVSHQEVSWEYPGSTLGVSWEYPGSTLGISWEVLWEYPGKFSAGSTLGISWEYPWKYPGNILCISLPRNPPGTGPKRVSGDFLTWNAGVNI